MQFKDVPGLEETKEKLRNHVMGARVPHAQLFLGPRGSANLALALAYVQFLGCEQRTELDSCGNCPSCNKLAKLIHPDLHFSFPTVGSKALSTAFMEQWRKALVENPYFDVFEWLQMLDGESKQGNITVDECRDIIRRLSMKSFESEYRYLVLWLPEYLGKEGNTLLKLIEEPPEKTIFILVAHDQEAILPTIRSRTQLMAIPRFREEDLIKYLLEKELCNEQQAEVIAFMSDGNLNRAIQLSGLEETSFFTSFRTWLLACYHRKLDEMLNWSDKASQIGRESQKQLLEYGIKLLREVLLYKNGGEELIRIQGAEREFVAKFAQLVDNTILEKMTQVLGQNSRYIERNANPKITLFHLSLEFKNIMASSRAK